jgi:hypothetical protein
LQNRSAASHRSVCGHTGLNDWGLQVPPAYHSVADANQLPRRPSLIAVGIALLLSLASGIVVSGIILFFYDSFVWLFI